MLNYKGTVHALIKLLWARVAILNMYIDALLKNGFSDIRCCYHSNIYQMYIKYCSVCIYMVNVQYKVYNPKYILICANP